MDPIISQLASEIENTLQEAGQINLLPELAKELSTRSQKATKSRVISATELSEAQKEKIKEKLKLVEMDFIIDESILGGLVVESEGKRQDMSLRSKLNLIKNSITK